MDIWYAVSKGICLAYIKVLVRGYQVSGRENLIPGAKIIVEAVQVGKVTVIPKRKV